MELKLYGKYEMIGDHSVTATITDLTKKTVVYRRCLYGRYVDIVAMSREQFERIYH